jgi:NADH-quinone oxidoreductase subunit M
MVFALASLGLPGLGNFVAEFLILLGVYRNHVVLAALAAGGLVVATVYALSFIARTFHGPRQGRAIVSDLSLREMTILTAMVVTIVWLGLYPQPILDTAAPVLASVAQSTSDASTARGQ